MSQSARMNPVSTFAGLPACSDLSTLSAEIAIVGIPHGTPYRPRQLSHAAQAPNAIRAGKIRVVDCGDVAGDPNDPAGNRQRATAITRFILDAGVIPIVLGGDDSVVIPFLRAFEQCQPLVVVQIDAHVDWRDKVKGVTEGYSSTMRRASEMPWIEKLIQVGMRGVGSARLEDVEAAQAYGAEIITAQQVYKNGIDQVLDLVPEGSAVLVTIDCDGLDPSIMPAVIAPSPGGLLYQHVIDLVHGLCQKARVVGFDLVELVPERDPNGLAALTAARIICNAIGALVRSRQFAS
jgi:agmatinase